MSDHPLFDQDAPVTITPANVAIVWNDILLDAIATSASSPPVASRTMAIESPAVFNALSAIEGTPGYLINLTAPEGDAPVAAVAHSKRRLRDSGPMGAAPAHRRERGTRSRWRSRSKKDSV